MVVGASGGEKSPAPFRSRCLFTNAAHNKEGKTIFAHKTYPRKNKATIFLARAHILRRSSSRDKLIINDEKVS